jgi:predicted SAM-dependent methyltransferase
MCKIDLGCGRRKKPGYIGLDVMPSDDVDIVCDLGQGIPLRSNVAISVYSNQVLEHIQDTVLIGLLTSGNSRSQVTG